MKRILIAFDIVFLLLGLQGVPNFSICKYGKSSGLPVRLNVTGYPDDCIDRFDTCHELSSWMYISYLVDKKFYCWVVRVSDSDVAIFKPFTEEDLEGGYYSFYCTAEIEKKYENELPANVNLSAEDMFFYNNRPKGFEVLKRICIKAKKFYLVIDLFNQEVIYKCGTLFSKGTLDSFYYL